MPTLQSINPASEEVLATFDAHTQEQVEEALAKSSEVARRQRFAPIADRAKLMAKAGEILSERSSHWAHLLTAEMGKPIKAAVSEVEKCAWVCRYYAEHGEEFMTPESYPSDASNSYLTFQPLGPVLAVMPWNFPFWQVFRFAAPALVAGNTGLLKHASNVPQCAKAIEEIFLEAGFEEGAFQTLLVGSDRVQGILEDDRVKAATLTGSEGAGRAVAKVAGKELKRTVLELGGSDPFIVMPSANFDDALDAAVKARTINNGQSCIAAKRFLVHSDLYERFLDEFRKRFEALEVGDPTKESTDIGPLATSDIRDEVQGQVEDSVKAGASRVTGAEPIEGRGFFYKPGILADIPKDSPAYSEEVFGPVAMIFEVKDLDQAIHIANDTRFGLGSAIFTNDEDEQKQAVDQLDAGATFVNSIVASDPRLPFGGIKASGYGRELSELGMREFVNQKTVSIA